MQLRQHRRLPGRYREDKTPELLPNPTFVIPTVPFNPRLRPAAFPTLPLNQFPPGESASDGMDNKIGEIDTTLLGGKREEVENLASGRPAFVFKDLKVKMSENTKIELRPTPLDSSGESLSEYDGYSTADIESDDEEYKACQDLKAYRIHVDWNDISEGMQIAIVRELCIELSFFEVIEQLCWTTEQASSFIELYKREKLRIIGENVRIARVNQQQLSLLMNGPYVGYQEDWLAVQEELFKGIPSPATLIISRNDLERGVRFLRDFRFIEMFGLAQDNRVIRRLWRYLGTETSWSDIDFNVPHEDMQEEETELNDTGRSLTDYSIDGACGDSESRKRKRPSGKHPSKRNQVGQTMNSRVKRARSTPKNIIKLRVPSRLRNSWTAEDVASQSPASTLSPTNIASSPILELITPTIARNQKSRPVEKTRTLVRKLGRNPFQPKPCSDQPIVNGAVASATYTPKVEHDINEPGSETRLCEGLQSYLTKSPPKTSRNCSVNAATSSVSTIGQIIHPPTGNVSKTPLSEFHEISSTSPVSSNQITVRQSSDVSAKRMTKSGEDQTANHTPLYAGQSSEDTSKATISGSLTAPRPQPAKRKYTKKVKSTVPGQAQQPKDSRIDNWPQETMLQSTQLKFSGASSIKTLSHTVASPSVPKVPEVVKQSVASRQIQKWKPPVNSETNASTEPLNILTASPGQNPTTPQNKDNSAFALSEPAASLKPVNSCINEASDAVQAALDKQIMEEIAGAALFLTTNSPSDSPEQGCAGTVTSSTDKPKELMNAALAGIPPTANPDASKQAMAPKLPRGTPSTTVSISKERAALNAPTAKKAAFGSNQDKSILSPQISKAIEREETGEFGSRQISPTQEKDTITQSSKKVTKSKSSKVNTTLPEKNEENPMGPAKKPTTSSRRSAASSKVPQADTQNGEVLNINTETTRAVSPNKPKALQSRRIRKRASPLAASPVGSATLKNGPNITTDLELNSELASIQTEDGSKRMTLGNSAKQITSRNAETFNSERQEVALQDTRGTTNLSNKKSPRPKAEASSAGDQALLGVLPIDPRKRLGAPPEVIVEKTRSGAKSARESRLHGSPEPKQKEKPSGRQHSGKVQVVLPAKRYPSQTSNNSSEAPPAKKQKVTKGSSQAAPSQVPQKAANKTARKKDNPKTDSKPLRAPGVRKKKG